MSALTIGRDNARLSQTRESERAQGGVSVRRPLQTAVVRLESMSVGSREMQTLKLSYVRRRSNWSVFAQLETIHSAGVVAGALVRQNRQRPDARSALKRAPRHWWTVQHLYCGAILPVAIARRYFAISCF